MIEYAKHEGVARLTLARPEKRNALNQALITALRQAFDSAAQDAAVRVILLRGAGKDFCAGLDLADLRQDGDAMDHFASARTLADLYLAMRRNPKVIIAAVHGRAIGGGAGLATACDLIVAAESAELRYPEVNMGFIAAIVMSMLRRQVSEKRAFEIVALGESVPASVAKESGIVNQVFADAEFSASAEAYAADVAAKPASALTLTKDLLYHIDGMNFESAVHAGLYGNALARMTEAARRGFEGFLKK